MVFTSLICLICREEEPDFLTVCNHNFHKNCLKQWHKRIKNECPYCRGFIILNQKFNRFLKNIEKNCKEIVMTFGKKDFNDIFSYFERFKPDERIFKHLIPTIKTESTKSYVWKRLQTVI